jgi:hypothetical protein
LRILRSRHLHIHVQRRRGSDVAFGDGPALHVAAWAVVTPARRAVPGLDRAQIGGVTN